jgi:hypothetical protein
MTSASFHVSPGYLQTAASTISLLPIVTQTPVTSTEIRGDRSMGNIFSSQEAVSLIKVIIWNKEPLMGFEMSLRAEPHLYLGLAAVY